MAGVTLPLLTLSAACLGTQLTLSTDNLPFGTVVLGSEVSNVCVIGLQYFLSLLVANVWPYQRLIRVGRSSAMQLLRLLSPPHSGTYPQARFLLSTLKK